MKGVSFKVHLEDILTRTGFDEQTARDNAVAMLQVIRSPALKETPFALLTPFSSAPPVFSTGVNSFRVRSDLGLCLVLDLVALKRGYEEHN